MRCPNERPDDADAGQGFAHDLVDPIELDLDGPEEWDRAAHDESDHGGHERQHDQEQAGQGDISAEGHDDPADDQDRGGDQDRQAHEDNELDLLDVVRVAGDEGGRPESVDLDLRERLDLGEDRGPHVAPEAHRHPCAPVHADDGGDPEQARDEEHQGTGPEDVVVVAARDSVVDDVGVQIRQVEVAERLDE